MLKVITRTVKEMLEVAYRPQETTLNPEDLAYIVVRNPGRNLTITPPVKLGGSEYPKTYGHFHNPPYAETYQVLVGKAGFLIQKEAAGKVTDAQLQIVLPGVKFTVPAGYGHICLNLGDDYLITLDNHDPAHFENDYQPIKEKKGMAYYILDKGGKVEAVPNPAYGPVPPLKING
ncbi:MAG: glucose-6-phosphate isomerase family protein [Patescibacteria group bacterium]